MKSRKYSSIINLRIFHNWIKDRLIRESIEQIKNNNTNYSIAILDLATGRGGDILKWYKNNIYNAIGIDINKKSIYGKNGAIHRYKQLVRKLKAKNKKVPDYKFYVYDLSKRKNIKQVMYQLKNKKFDIVSCNFAIHYFFDKQTSLNTLLTIVQKCLKPGGIFFGTTMDGSMINQMFMKGPVIKKNIYYLESVSEINDMYTPYGNQYKIDLGKKEGETHYFAKEPSVEYMVDIGELKYICNKHQLRFIGTIQFDAWYKIYTKEYLTKYTDKALSDEEKEFSFLNFSFYFMKTNDS